MFFSLTKPAARMDARAAIDLAAKGELVVVDIRDASELRQSGTAKGALHVPMVVLADRADPRHPEHDKRLSPAKPVALYCASGARSQMAAGMLAKLGYETVYNIGGFADWARAGGPVVRG